ncbi:MAG: 2'-5' RNA ligase family protein [Tunicatimonas sp.]
MTASDYPLVLTLSLDEETTKFFNQLRQRHFPAEHNHLKAHLTLFHQLPGAEAARIIVGLEEVSQRYRPLKLAVSEVRLLGRGVAYRLESTLLQQLHRQLQKQWRAYLTPQDQQKLWPHVTVQNKVTPDEAKRLHTQLSEGFKPFEAVGTGLHLWEYHGGPWESKQEFAFGRGSSTP